MRSLCSKKQFLAINDEGNTTAVQETENILQSALPILHKKDTGKPVAIHPPKAGF
jgi:hypothetical protein